MVYGWVLWVGGMLVGVMMYGCVGELYVDGCMGLLSCGWVG